MLTAIIVPTLEEVDNVVPLVEQIEQAKVPFSEIIFVDDGSTDGTREQIRQLMIAHRVRLMERDGAERGLAGAIIAGAYASTADFFVVMDADLSHPPEEIPALLQPILANEADLVGGSRYIPGGATPGWPVWRRFLSRVASAVAYPLTGVHDSMGGFFAIRRESLLCFANEATGFKIVFETIVRGRKILRVREIPIVFRNRVRGVSKMSLGQAMRFALAWSRAIGRRITERKAVTSALPAQKSGT
ncbi:MAG TPA: glycosyltransferase [Chthoniobacterales bacterium]|nr:glycosyltransferase [Chthoniobacterales bacterium]